MLQTLDTFNKALLWTLAVGFSYVVLTQARARRNKHDLLSTMLHEHLITMPVLSALLLTGMTVAALDFVMLPGVFAAQEPTPPAAAAGRGVLEAYTLPDANVSVVEVQGKVSQR
ncbi:MAG: hypothetical protein M1482_04265, partial [Chloroflexi bacterium]|nr:hypothetical protein [Chloroflexota bacterium]